MSNEIKRMRYFNGLLLKEEDLNLEQNYNMRLHRLHNRYFHDWGIMDGLEVEAVVGAPQVKVSPGMALNRVLIEGTKEEHSQEVLICDNHPDNPVDLSTYTPADNIYITVCYEEVPADVDRQKGGHEIHIWERASIKHSNKKPIDPRKDIVLALVKLEADEAGNKKIREISDTDIDGETKLRTYAVLRGQALEVDKLSVGPKEKLGLPYITGLNDSLIGEGDGLDFHSPFTRFTGSIISGSINTLGNVNIKGALTVTTNNKQALKVNPAGNIDIVGATAVGGKLSVTGGLSVKGDSTTIDTTQVAVTNNMVTISKYTPGEGETDPKIQSSGIEVFRGGTAPSTRLVWDESEKVWKAGMDKRADIPESGMYAIAYGTDWDRMHGHSNVDDLHKHGKLYTSDDIEALSVGSTGDVQIKNSIVASGSVISNSGSFEAPRQNSTQNAKLIWNDADGRWQVSAADKVYNLLYGNEWDNLTSGANADLRHSHSQLFNSDGTAMALRANPAGNVDIPLNLTVGEKLTVKNLDVLGTTTTVNTVNLQVTDNVIVVNKCEPGMQPIAEGGLEVYRGGGELENARIIWDEGSDHWKIGVGSNMVEMAYGSQWEELTHGAVAENLHKHSQLYTESGTPALAVDAGGNTEAEGDVLVNGELTVEENAKIKGSLAVDGSMAITGDLTISGTTTTVNTETLEVNDKVIVVNKYTGQSTPLGGQSGLEVYRGGTEENAKVVWDEAEGKWKAGIGDEIADLAYGADWETLISETSADSLHKHGQLCGADGSAALSVNTEGKVEMYGDTEVAGAFSVGGSMTVEGDLVVKGTTVTQVDMEVTDNVIVLNKYTEGASPVNESGIEIYRGKEAVSGIEKDRARIVWDEFLKKWRMGIGSELQEIAGGRSWDVLTNKSNADKLHQHSQIYNEKGDILALSATASGNVDVAHGMVVGQSLKVQGNFDVRGGLTTINTPIFEVLSNTVVVNRYEPGVAPLGTKSGLMVYRGINEANAIVIWDEDNNRWKIGASTEGPGLIVNSDGSVIASGRMQAAEANVTGGLQAASVNIQGGLTVKTGMEVSLSGGQKAHVMWDEVVKQWKIGTGTSTSSSTGISVTEDGRLGVGTETPNAMLDVNGDVNVGRNLTAESAEVTGSLTVKDRLTVNGSLVSGNGLEVNRGIDSAGKALPNARIYWDNAQNKWLFGTEGNLQEIMLNNHKHNNLFNWDGSITALSVDSSGKIGIGTTTPTAKLDVSGDAQINGKLTTKTGLEILRTSGAKPKLYWEESGGGKWQAGTEGNLKDISLYGHTHQILHTSSGTAAVNVSYNGDVGIGNTSPTTKLDVTGNIKATNVIASGTLTGSGINAANATVTGDLNAGSAIVSGNLNAASATITNDLTVDGNLTVNGNMVTVNTATLEVEDNIVRVNKYAPQATPINVNGGLEVFRGGTAPNAQIIWDETTDKWQAGTMGGLKELSYSDHKHDNIYTSTGVAAMNVDAAGNVGIGTAEPGAKLDVQGDAKVSGNINAANATVSGALNTANATISGTLNTANATVSGGFNAASAVVSGNLNAASATITNDLTVDGNLTVNGNMVTVNTATLEVEDNIVRVNKYAPQGTPAVVDGGLEVFRGGTAPNAQIIWNETSDTWQAGTMGSLKELSYSDHKHSNVCAPDGTTVMNIISGGNVGIGTATPTAKLDVAGHAKVSGNIDAASATVSGGISAGSINVNGNLNGNSAILSGNVGIGTATPGAKLDVQGDAKVSGSINAANATVSGALNAASAAISGTLNTVNAAVSGSLGAVSASVSGGLSAANATITNDLTVGGNLTVNGSTVTVNTASLEVKDNIVRVNKYTPQAIPVNINGGLEVFRGGTAPNAQIIWDEATDTWQAGTMDSLKELSYSDHKHSSIYTAAGAAAMNVDAAGNIGIGTETPGAKFDVQGDAKVSGSLNTVNVIMSGSLSAAAASVSGNVGIGTATPSAKLDVQGDTKISGNINAASVAVSGSLSASNATVGNAVVNGSLTVANGIEVARGAEPKAQFIWNEATDTWQVGTAGNLKELLFSDHKHSSVYTPDGSTSVMNISSGGNVGIGTASPSTKLDVQGDAKISGSINASNATMSGSLSSASATVSGNLNAGNVAASGSLSAAAASISGNVGIGTANPSAKLDVVGDAKVSGNINAASATIGSAVVNGSLTVANGIEVARGAEPKAQIIWNESTDTWQVGTAGNLRELLYGDHKHSNLYTSSGGAIAMNVDADGNVGIGKTPVSEYKLDINGDVRAITFNQTSSKDYKENIEQLNDKAAVDLLAKLKPVTFDYKADNVKKRNIGFIAEEVPDIFATSDHKAVSIMDIVGVLTSVVKTQQKEMTSMKKQMTALKKQVAALASA